MNFVVNPFLKCEVDEFDGYIKPIYELKFGLVFYTNYPPGPKRARKIFDIYYSYYKKNLARYISTCPGSIPQDWVSNSLDQFHKELLPNIRKTCDWGYGFDDGKITDSYLFMFHGYRPVSEKGKASFFRFEFPWNIDQEEVRDIAIEIAKEIPFENGFSGYFLKPSIDAESYNSMYAICRRFWGVEAWNLDETVNFVLDGYKSVNWLTFIGESLIKRMPESLKKTKSVAFDYWESKNGVVLQSAKQALLGDQNRQEDMEGYVLIAKALLPLQITNYGKFGGELWNEENSLQWIKRFTSSKE